eukprot:1721392-Rhodomonas_salina.1
MSRGDHDKGQRHSDERQRWRDKMARWRDEKSDNVTRGCDNVEKRSDNVARGPRFPEGTARTWCMTYVDADTRIVRAGLDGGR